MIIHNTTLFKLACTQEFKKKGAPHDSSLKRRIEELNNFEASKRLGEVVVLVVWLCIEIACLWKLAWELIGRTWSSKKYCGDSQKFIDPRSSKQNKRKKRKYKDKKNMAQGSEHQLLGRKEERNKNSKSCYPSKCLWSNCVKERGLSK